MIRLPPSTAWTRAACALVTASTLCSIGHAGSAPRATRASEAVAAPSRTPKEYGQENALWAESSFLRGEVPSTHAPIGEADVVAFARLLRANHVRDLFLFAGPYGRDGSVPSYARAPFARRAIAILRAECPGLRILPWLGGLQFKQVRLQDPAWVDRAIAETASLLQDLGLDAVHVNFEYLLFGREPSPELRYHERFLAFFRQLRARLPRAYVSTVVTSTAPDTVPWKYKHSFEEVATILPYVDQVALLYFDTNIHERDVFERNMAAQVAQVRRWRAMTDRPVAFLMGVGTFVNDDPVVRRYRDLSLENPRDDLRVLRGVVDAAPDARPIDGLAIFCSWQTDADEWAALRDGWTERRPGDERAR